MPVRYRRGMKLQSLLIATSLVLPTVFGISQVGYAQSDVNVKVDKNTPGQQPPKQQAPSSVSVSAQPVKNAKEVNPGVEFSKLGGSLAPAPVVSSDANSLMQVTAPLGASGTDSVLVHLYQKNDALFMDVLTAKGKQAWTKRNTVRLIAPYPDHPGNMKVTLRYLEPRKKSGLMIVASDDSMHYVLTFPKGLGATVAQQQFLATAKDGTQSTYDFGDLDGRGYAIVKATVVSTSGGANGDAMQYFVWNGTRFIPRAKN